MRCGVIIATILVIILNTSGCKRMVDSSSNTERKNSNHYEVTTARVGDLVGGMIIKDIKLVINPNVPSDECVDFYVVFDGEFEMDGIFAEELGSGYNFSNENYVVDVLPYSSYEWDIDLKKNYKMKVLFNVTNEDELLNEIKKVKSNYEKGDAAKIKAVFSSYSYDIWGFEYEHSAKFERLIKVY